MLLGNQVSKFIRKKALYTNWFSGLKREVVCDKRFVIFVTQTFLKEKRFALDKEGLRIIKSLEPTFLFFGLVQDVIISGGEYLRNYCVTCTMRRFDAAAA